MRQILADYFIQKIRFDPPDQPNPRSKIAQCLSKSFQGNLPLES
ncbi:MAG TPA: hypothetical protein PKY59_17455 [Pyrinomonadaceae bacterium]|nr:hypothetical protein [Pyrinomonadaceae bacterium]